MGNDDETPTDKRDTLDLILECCQRTEQQAKDTRVYAERSHDVSLQMFEEHKALSKRVAGVEQRAWAPALVSVLAAIICIACAVAAR